MTVTGINGRVERIHLTCPQRYQSVRGAEQYERLVLAELHAGRDPRAREDQGPARKKSAPTVAEFREEFIEACRGKDNKPRELAAKEQLLRQHLVRAPGHRRLDDIDEPVVDRYRSSKISKGLSPKTVRNQLGVLQRVLRIALRRKLIDSVPSIEMPKKQKLEPNFLRFEETDKFVAAAKGD